MRESHFEIFNVFCLIRDRDKQAPLDPSRIVSVAEIIYLLGEEDKIIAADRTSNYPPEALELPSIGYVRALSTEGVLSLES